MEKSRLNLETFFNCIYFNVYSQNLERTFFSCIYIYFHIPFFLPSIISPHRLPQASPPLQVQDLFQDIQDGHILMVLLEELSGCSLVNISAHFLSLMTSSPVTDTLADVLISDVLVSDVLRSRASGSHLIASSDSTISLKFCPSWRREM